MKNYEQKYKEAIEAMKDCIPDKDGYVTVRPCDIFPELKESEDEQTRKEIFHFILDNTLSTDMRQHRWLAWLEKQAEKPEVDGFDAELNALMEKYEHLPKLELIGSLNFYIGVINRMEE